MLKKIRKKIAVGLTFAMVVVAGVKVLLFFFPGINDDITDWRGVEGFLVLEVGREVDAVVFADVFDGVRG